MRKILAKAVLLVYCSSLLALPSQSQQGFYLGALVGYSWVDYKPHDFPVTAVPNRLTNTGIAPAYLIGYQWRSYLSTEISATYIHRAFLYGLPKTPAFVAKVRHNVLAASIKLRYPVRYSFYPFVKLGIAYVARNNLTDKGIVVVHEGMFVRPVLAMGVDYSLKGNWTAELQGFYVPAAGSKGLPKAYYLAVGAYYRWG